MIDQRTAPLAALLLRVTLGSLFIAHKIRHTPRRPRHVVVEFCKERIPADHSMVRHNRRVRWRDLVDTGYFDALGSALCASIDCWCSALLGDPQGVLLYRGGRRIARGLVGHACDPIPTGRRALRRSSFIRLSNAIENRLAAVIAHPATNATADRSPKSRSAGAPSDGSACTGGRAPPNSPCTACSAPARRSASSSVAVMSRATV